MLSFIQAHPEVAVPVALAVVDALMGLLRSRFPKAAAAVAFLCPDVDGFVASLLTRKPALRLVKSDDDK